MAAPSIHAALRAATADDHAQVDAAFSRFDLADAASYGDFLVAQARALLPAETVLATIPDLPGWRPRAAALRGDLALLDRAPPPPLAIAPPAGRAGALGMLYVLEGSRLGGAILVDQVPPALPRAYLGARHLPGEWRHLLAALDAEARAGGDAWLGEAVAGAHTMFDRFRRAASPTPDPD